MGILQTQNKKTKKQNKIKTKQKIWRERFIRALVCGFHFLKHLSSLSRICTLARYGLNFKQHLSCIYQGQIWKHICPTFVVFTTRTNITSDLSHICLKAKYDPIHYFIQCLLQKCWSQHFGEKGGKHISVQISLEFLFTYRKSNTFIKISFKLNGKW